MPVCKFTNKTHTSSFMYFTFIFSECITITSSEEGLKVCECNFFQRKVVLLVIYLFNHDSFKPTIFTIFLLNMSFEVLLSAVSCNIKLFALCFDRYFFLLKPNYSPPWWYNFLFWHLYQIHTFNNNLNEEGITSHLMCAIFFMINLNVVITFTLTFQQQTETLGKHVTW